jgi:hypothetical protein
MGPIVSLPGIVIFAVLHALLQVREPSAVVEHEASTSKIGEDQLFYFQSRGVEAEAAVGMIISGFCREVSKAGGLVARCHSLPGFVALCCLCDAAA